MALLKKISDRNQNLLRASTYINSFKRVVEELVYNSLDADSTSIAIRVCIDNKYIQVLDNGIGITKDNFRLLGDKYVTSKFIDVTSLKCTSDKYGYKGISLASIIEVSEHVKISSKFKNSQETWMKKFCKGSVEEFILTTSRPSKGTTVEISGFLYNLNIQRKSINLLKELSNIKLALEQLSLAHCNVSFSLRDDSKNEIIFKIHKNRNIYQTLWSLFEINRNDLKDLQVEKNQYKVKAYIGKDCLVSKKYQWVFLNGRFISKTFLHIKIHENFTRKNFNKTKVKFTDEYNFNCKIPFYFIFIMCPNYDYDFNYNQRQTFVEFKNCEEVNNLIKKLINLYYGDIKVKPLVVREEINEDYNNDTRKKVKEIMEKILNKNERKANITQLQNGIKEHSRTKQVKTTYDLLKTNENKEKNPINIFTDPQNNVIEESIDSCMSQIFEEKLKKNTDYNDDEKYYEDAIYNHFAEDVHDKFEIFEPRVKNVKEIVSKNLNKVNDKINKDNADLIFSSESLQQAQILGQVDKKFIAARMQSRYSSGGKSSHFLTLFDQHAVDERVRLERNLSDYFDGNKWKSVAFEKFQLKLSHDDYFYLYNYKDKFTQFGLQWTFAEKHVLIHAVPEAILGKNPRKAEIIFTAIKKLISEQIDLIQSSRGNVSSYPKCIMELIFSEACRYAIKFGDQLSKDDCVNMIGALANCKTPFQCAHGRPVMAIIMEIPNNNLTYTVLILFLH
ncbi:DNA mismatch repair protein Mlh3-like [Vanessa tameamea]|uniref:DNA mismatch repair protein Mlh3-like n=1 Tax=Vanessa tameamea TaxID=334116 RepID=A0ABM4AMW1_VANTA